MATERVVTVRVNMVAGGNAGAAMRANADAARGMGGAAFQPGAVNQPGPMAAAGGGASNANIFKGLAMGMGAVAAASPAAFETLTGSAKLLAGELGILLIPAVVRVSGFLQNLAEKVKGMDDMTGGAVTKVASFSAIVGLAWVATTRLTASLNQAAAAMAYGGAATGNVAAAGMGTMLGRLGGAVKIGAVGTVASQAAGSMIGGKAGDLVSAAGTGASIGGAIGSFAGPMGTIVGGVVGGGIGLIVGAISEGFDGAGEKLAKIDLGFKGGSLELGGVGALIQSQSLRDPLKQAEFEQEMRAMQKLIDEVHGMRVEQRPANWQANQ